MILPPTLNEVCERALRLPCSPAMLPRLIMLLDAPDSSSEQIAELIKLDASLTTSTLRLANSAFFSGGSETESVADAILRLGQRELFRLAALALVSRWEPTCENVQPGDFCRHALCTALGAEVLAENCGEIDPALAYTAGLTCDLGKLAIAHACADFFPVIRSYCVSKKATLSLAEYRVLGFTHGQVAASLLKSWNFPTSLCAAAEFCDRPNAAPEEYHSLLAHLHAGKYVATSIGCGVAEEAFFFELNPEFLLRWNITSATLQEMMPIVLDRAKSRLQEKLTHGVIKI
jgi:HD-like signal output (HDOD) protein